MCYFSIFLGATVTKTSNLANMVKIAEKRQGLSALLAEARSVTTVNEWSPKRGNVESDKVSKQFLESFGSHGLKLRFK